jgi:hypothetical protein
LIAVRLAAGIVDCSKPLAACSLLLHLGGRRREQLGWDEAALTADGSAIEARIRRDGIEIRTTVTPAPDALGFDIETVLAARPASRFRLDPEPLLPAHGRGGHAARGHPPARDEGEEAGSRRCRLKEATGARAGKISHSNPDFHPPMSHFPGNLGTDIS